MKFKVGDQVTWSSQSQGSSKAKTGIVRAIVPKGQSAIDVYPALVETYRSARGRVKVDFHSLGSRDRYLVEVDRGEGKVTWFYTPLVGVVDRCMEQNSAND